MRLIKARVQNYRSIIDSGEFEIEKLKTILVGPNEAGKTVLLKALQQLKKPDGVDGFDALRDYPRSKYNDITTGKVNPKDVTVVTGIFELEDKDKELIPRQFHNCKYKVWRNLENNGFHGLIDGPGKIVFEDIKKDFLRMISHMDEQFSIDESVKKSTKPIISFQSLTAKLSDNEKISGDIGKSLKSWLDNNYKFVKEGNEKEEKRHSELLEKIQFNSKYDEVLKTLDERRVIVNSCV